MFLSPLILGLFLILSSSAASGCAIHYFDPKTGAEHIWGVGHMVMKAAAPREGHRAIVLGTETIGFSVGNVGGQGYLTVGWEKRQRLEILDENTSIRLEWPNRSFFTIRVGSEWPRVFDETNAKGKEAEQ